MKKKMMMSLIAAFVTVLNVQAQGNAQDNTYNMVIEMANGTKLTIGPNEIKNIDFFDGDVVVTGTRLEDLLKKLADVRVWTIGEDGYWYKDGVKTEISAKGNDGVAGKDGTEWTIDEYGYWCANGEQTDYKAVSEGGSSEGIDELKEHVDALEAELKQEIAQEGDYVKQNDAQLQYNIDALEKYVLELEKKVAYLQEEHEKKVDYFEERVAYLLEQNAKRSDEAHILLDILKSKGLFPEDQTIFDE